MKVAYPGPSPSVELAVPGGVVICERGVAVEVPDDVAENLIEQGWKPSKKADPAAAEAKE